MKFVLYNNTSEKMEYELELSTSNFELGVGS